MLTIHQLFTLVLLSNFLSLSLYTGTNLQRVNQPANLGDVGRNWSTICKATRSQGERANSTQTAPEVGLEPSCATVPLKQLKIHCASACYSSSQKKCNCMRKQLSLNKSCTTGATCTSRQRNKLSFRLFIDLRLKLLSQVQKSNFDEVNSINLV